MSTLSGTVVACNFVRGPEGLGARKVYELAVNFTQTFTAGDIAQIVGVGAVVTAATKNGRTFTLVATALGAGLPSMPGFDSSNAAVYGMGPFTNTAGTLTFGVGSSSTNAAAVTPTGVKIMVVGDES